MVSKPVAGWLNFVPSSHFVFNYKLLTQCFPVAQMYLHFSFDRAQCALQHTLWWTSGQQCSDPFHHVSKKVIYFTVPHQTQRLVVSFSAVSTFFFFFFLLLLKSHNVMKVDVCVTFATFMPRQMQPSRPNQRWWTTRTRPLQHSAATLPTLLLPSKATIGPIMARPLTKRSQPLTKLSLNMSMFLNLM